MRLGLLIFGITAFLIANTYHDGKYTKLLLSYHKYYKMAMFAFLGLSIYIFIKKHPGESKSLFSHANNIIKYMPIDSGTSEVLAPFLDFTNANSKINSMYAPEPEPVQSRMAPQMKRMLRSGANATKRSVSETKKKYVASQQGWKCAACQQILDATFEVDHKVDLQFGGSNEVSNLHALCPNCHRKKGMMTKL